jgi:hypothetical protein
MAYRKEYPRWTPLMGRGPVVKGVPMETIGLSALGALAAVGIDSLLNVPTSQIKAESGSARTNDVLLHVLPSFAATTLAAGATWWISGSKTAGFAVEAVGLLYFVPKIIAAIFE